MNKIKGVLKIGIFVLVLSFFSACNVFNLYSVKGDPFPYSFIPDTLQPSYHTFKNMCKLNFLPDGEKKYNKMLAYFGLSLDTIDWEEFNKKVKKYYAEDEHSYLEGDIYGVSLKDKNINARVKADIYIYSNEPIINKTNIIKMYVYAEWLPYTKSLIVKSLSGLEFYYNKKGDKFTCSTILTLPYSRINR